MHIVLSGGGTGGHLTPLLGVARALKAQVPDVKLSFIGQVGESDEKAFSELGIVLYRISAGKFRRYHGKGPLQLLDLKTQLLNARDLSRFLLGAVESRRLLRRLQPDAVFCNGGYVTLPVGLAAGRLKLPLLIHESDMILGLANKLLSSKARAIATGFPVQYYSEKLQTKMIFTGIPLRPDLQVIPREQAARELELDPNLPTIFVTCGSQGARPVNRAIFHNLKGLLERFQVIHLIGLKNEIEFAGKQPSDLKYPERYQQYVYMHGQYLAALSLADIVIARAGATTIAELAAFGKPSIIVPNPYLTAGHQVRNAEILERAGAAMVLPESELPKLVEKIDSISSKEKQNQMSLAISKFATQNAAQEVAQALLKLAQP